MGRVGWSGRDPRTWAEREQRARVDLEMEVERRPEGVAGVADEAEHLTCSHARSSKRRPRIAGEVRVVELVGEPIAHPEAPAAEPPPADPVQGPVRDSDDRRSERREDVVAVMPGDVAPGGAVAIAEGGRSGNREDVVLQAERRR